jgi:hypothetical protein
MSCAFRPVGDGDEIKLKGDYAKASQLPARTHRDVMHWAGALLRNLALAMTFARPRHFLAVSAMPDRDSDLEKVRQELRDLATALMRQDPALDQHTRAIAEAKILTLQRQLETLEEMSAHAGNGTGARS